MSSSLKSHIASRAVATAPSLAVRRRLLLTLALAPVAALASAGDPGPSPYAGLKRWGSGDFSRFGLTIYRATLWAGDDAQRPPLVLQLDYRRAISGTKIAAASVAEIRRLALADAATLQRWGEQLAALIPDVASGDAISGHYLPGGAHFYFNGRPIGAIEDAQFARAFFAIWLDARTSAPELRTALLGGQAA